MGQQLRQRRRLDGDTVSKTEKADVLTAMENVLCGKTSQCAHCNLIRRMVNIAIRVRHAQATKGKRKP